jgi:hypothetical protein
VIAAHPALDADRQHALSEALSLTTMGVDSYGDEAIRSAAMRLIDPIIQLADHAVAARHEYEACDRRLDVHVRTHPGCVERQHCSTREDIRRNRDCLLAAWDRAFRALLDGRR